MHVDDDGSRRLYVGASAKMIGFARRGLAYFLVNDWWVAPAKAPRLIFLVLQRHHGATRHQLEETATIVLQISCERR